MSVDVIQQLANGIKILTSPETDLEDKVKEERRMTSSRPLRSISILEVNCMSFASS